MKIRKIRAEEFADFVRLQINAFPGVHLANEQYRQEMVRRCIERQQTPGRNFYGVFRQKMLVGGMQLYDFTMRLYSCDVALGGIGSVATDLLCKKEKIAKAIIEFFLRHYRERGFAVVALNPFRPDFYKQMGFGYGTKMNRYCFPAANVMGRTVKDGLRHLYLKDLPLLLDCYNRYACKTHGMIRRDASMMELALKDHEVRAVGVEEAGRITGYILMRFLKYSDNYLVYDLEVMEWLYETTETLQKLLTFLNTQSDQVRAICLHTQEEDFHFLLKDPRNGSHNLLPCFAHESNTQGTGIMYRIIDKQRIFLLLADHNFGGQNLRLRLSIHDAFLPENAGNMVIHFWNGRPHVCQAEANYEVSIEMDIADFSSLLMGVVSFEKLYSYGLAKLSDAAYLDRINRLFYAHRKPVCMERF